MAVFYKVTVEKVETDVPFTDKEYKYTKEDNKNSTDYMYFNSTKTIKTNIFEQTIKELNIKKLVSIINDL